MNGKFFMATILALCASVSSVESSAQSLALRPATTLGELSGTASSTSQSAASANSQGGAAQGVGSQGQAMSIDSHATYQAQERNPVATAVAPSLTSSNDTCMGATSVGASAVSFGLSVGSTWTDNNCVMLKNSRELWNMGFKGAALARLCMDPLNREAFEATGIECPPARQSKTSEGSSQKQASASDLSSSAGTADNTRRN
ncbi:MAG TPA: hypothetical protein VF450_19865 [Noviherbaspirillum sp.]|jgi:hypothetical protein